MPFNIVDVTPIGLLAVFLWLLFRQWQKADDRAAERQKTEDERRAKRQQVEDDRQHQERLHQREVEAEQTMLLRQIGIRLSETCPLDPDTIAAIRTLSRKGD